jgi:Bacterial archaeo-eukaryotic release factor family 3
MRLPVRTDLATLLAGRQPPCVSLYLATDRSYPAEQQGPIRYKNAITAAEEMLRQQYPGHQVNDLLDRFRALIDDQYFWSHRLDGLAIFGARDLFEVFDLQRQPREATVVADSFHVKPLLRYTQSADRFQVLCLQRTKCWMLAGNRYALDDIDLRGVPATVTEALGGEVVEGQVAVGAYGPGTGGTHHAPGKPTVPHGHAAEGSDQDRDTRRFFQAVDKYVWELHSRPSGLPLVLATLPQYQTLFREHSQNLHLVRDGIIGDPGGMGRSELVQAAWKAVEPHYLDRLNKFTNDFELARSRGQGSDDLNDVAAAACGGRVGILLIDADKSVPGRLDRGTGRWQPSDAKSPGVDDVLDDLGEVVLKMKGDVVIVPPDQMPTRTGAAAVYRY